MGAGLYAKVQTIELQNLVINQNTSLDSGIVGITNRGEIDFMTVSILNCSFT